MQVAGPDGVDAHVHHDLQLALCGPLVEGSPEGTQIVVQVHAVELDTPAVQVKTVIGGELEAAETEADDLAVEQLPLAADLYPEPVEVGMVDIP